MKIKILNGLLIVDILTVLLILAITFIPSNVARVILGLPFLLFFPGYALVSALFVEKEMKGVEQLAISCGTSIAIVGLIGFGLNYTAWGITLESALYSIATFIIVVSAIARIRRSIKSNKGALTTEINLKMLDWGRGAFGKSLSILLVVFILTAGGILGYTIIESKTGETFTEFYILGLKGQAQDYPSEFTLNGGHVISVKYSTGKVDTVNPWGKVTLGIVNHEQQATNYSVVVKIDNQLVNFYYNGQTLNRISDLQLQQGEKWEHEIAFAPQHLAENQKVEFLLFKGSDTSAGNSLHLWISASEPIK